MNRAKSCGNPPGGSRGARYIFSNHEWMKSETRNPKSERNPKAEIAPQIRDGRRWGKGNRKTVNHPRWFSVLAEGVIKSRLRIGESMHAGAAVWACALGLLTIVLAGCGQQPSSKTNAANANVPPADNLTHTACGMSMVVIPAGQFMMGANEGAIDAKPAHLVKVEGFLMDQNEVTQEAYEKVTGTNPSRRKNPRNPVEQVTWTAAVKFCNARSIQEGLKPCYDTNSWACDFSANGYRLPTEAEWEYACRSGSNGQYYYGENADELKSFAWF